MVREYGQKLRLKLWNLRESLRRIFERGDWTEQDAARVLDDMRKFCRVDTSSVHFDNTGRIDPCASAMLEGRREVFLWLQARLNMTDAQIDAKAKLDEDKEQE